MIQTMHQQPSQTGVFLKSLLQYKDDSMDPGLVHAPNSTFLSHATS